MPCRATPLCFRRTSVFPLPADFLRAWSSIPNRGLMPLGMRRLRAASHVSMPGNPEPCPHPRFSPACARLLRENERLAGVSSRGRLRRRGSNEILTPATAYGSLLQDLRKRTREREILGQGTPRPHLQGVLDASPCPKRENRDRRRSPRLSPSIADFPVDFEYDD